MELVGQRVVDGSVLALLEQFLKAGVLEELKGWQPDGAGHPARLGDQSAAGEPVSQPPGPGNGEAGMGNGTVGGRFCRAVPERRRSPKRAGVPAPMDRSGGIDPASDQDADRQRGQRRLRLSGLALLRGQEMAAQEESSETAGQIATADATQQRAQPSGDNR